MTNRFRQEMILAVAGVVFLLGSVTAGKIFRAASVVPDALDVVNYRYYSLDSWIGAIGLPDDPFKCVVDADGTFWSELGKSSERSGIYPLAPNQTPVKIQSHLIGTTERVEQRMFGPRVPISITRKRQGSITIKETLFLAWPLNWSADVKGAALKERNSRPQPRQYLLMTEYANTGDKTTEITPVLDLQGWAVGPNLDDDTMFELALNTYCQTTLAIESFKGENLEKSTLALKTLTIPPGENAVGAVDQSEWIQKLEASGVGRS